MKEKKHRVEDALQATRAALEEGIVPGGGVALHAARPSRSTSTGDGDEATGARIVMRALEEPLRQLATNAGLEGSVVVNRRAQGQEGLGPERRLRRDRSTSSRPASSIPAMVTRSALQNAASIAKNILTTEAIVAEAPEKAVRRWRRWHARHGRHARHDVGSSAPCDRSAGLRLRTRPRRRFPGTSQRVQA